MKKVLFIISLFLLSTVCFAFPVSHIVILGDSASDDGNLFKLTSGTVPQFPPYFNGRFSNGPTWAEFLGKYYFDRNNVSYKNYAYGGATARSFDEQNDLTLEGEVKAYLEDPQTPMRSNVLFVIWIGINDYLTDEKTDAEVLTDQVVDSIDKSVTNLIDHGAKNFVIMNIPDLSNAPILSNYPQKAVRVSQLFQLHNQKLARFTHKLRKRSAELNVIDIHMDSFWSDFLRDPANINKTYHVNIKNTKDACLDMASLAKGDPSQITHCQNPDEYIFWDNLHPTEVTQRVIAKLVLEKLDENQVGK